MTGRLKVYCIDNNSPAGEAASVALKALGHEFERFSDPIPFLERIKGEKPAFCIIDRDIRSSGEGLILARAISHVFSKALPIFVMIESSDKTAQETLQTIGAQPLFKPITHAAIEKCVAQATEPPVATPATPPTPAAQTTPRAPGTSNRHLDHFLEHIAPIITELGRSLESFEELEKRVKFYCHVLDPYSGKFLAFINSTRKGEKIKLDAAIRIFGVNQSRDAALAIKLLELVEPDRGFQWDSKTHKPRVPFNQVVKFAKKTIEHFGEDGRYKHVAYNAGLVFDVLSAINAKGGENKVKVQNLLEPLHSEALKIADASYELIKTGSGVALELYIVTACLLKNAGKIAMAMVEPTYADLLRLYETKHIPPPFQHVIEEKRYSYNHTMYAALLCELLPNQGKAFLPILWLDLPLFLSDKENKLRFDLASICQRGAQKLATPPAAANKK